MSYLDLPDYKPKRELTKEVEVVFDDKISHNGILQQVVEKLEAAGFASAQEIKEEWLTLLKVELESK